MKWKNVPEEPTEEMGDAGIAAWKAGRDSGTYVDDCYRAMLAAAPKSEHGRIKMTYINFDNAVIKYEDDWCDDCKSYTHRPENPCGKK